MWGGSFVVTINTKLLGGHISFFQCVCVLGYCIFPIVLAAFAAYVLKTLTIHSLLIKIMIAGVALVWSTLSIGWYDVGSISFMNVMIEEEKKYIATYPIFMFYLFIDWFILFIWSFLFSFCALPLITWPLDVFVRDVMVLGGEGVGLVVGARGKKSWGGPHASMKCLFIII